MRNILFILPILLILAGCGTKYATPPLPIQPGDFSEHNIDLEKYGIERIERNWDPNIKIPEEMIFEVMGEEQSNINYNAAYTLIYNNIQSNNLSNDTLGGYDSYEDVPFKEEKDAHHACIEDAGSEWDRKRDEICKDEEIINSSRQESIAYLEQREKDGVNTELQKKRVEMYRNDPTEVYGGCHLPAEVRHYLYVKEYNTWDQCEVDYRKILTEKGYLK